MKTLFDLCKPRASVFDAARRDTVLNLTDLVENRIKPADFFAENYVTEGMKVLLREAFRRLEGKSDQGVFKLKQAMGGGKTHNLLTLGLLAKHPELRTQALAGIHNFDPELGAVRVVAFTGRESDAPFGIWGSIAEQLGKKDQFKDYYSPLQAPGQTAWERLLANETAIILLDELPPYFENAKAKTIGNSDLAKVTETALSNLLVAIAREPCRRVCVVITDLAATYQGGSQQLGSALVNLENETNRAAMSLEPVRMNTDELYHILRTRLFETLPSESEIASVGQGYAKALRDAKQMDIAHESPEQFAARVQSSYPFHPAVRDLYARFRENPGFQQTRALIRLMRIVASRLWNTKRASKRYLIGAHDLDFNDAELLSEISQITPTFGNAIAHDIASGGNAVAEQMDAELLGTDTQDTCRLLLASSLANVPNAVVGLAIPEIVACLAEPGRDLSKLKAQVLAKLAISAWYLHSDRDGKLFFRDVQNLIAKLETIIRSVQTEQAVKALRGRIGDMFAPANRWCYQSVTVLPPLDEVELDQDRVTLVVTEPNSGPGLRPEIKAFHAQATWQNRVAFLTGSRDTYGQLLEAGKRLRAIEHILEELKEQNLPDNDPQMVQAKDLSDKIQQNFYSAMRETFTQVWYPFDDGLRVGDLRMRFEGNRYEGEKQIVDVLKDKQKFTDDITGETFRKKCEQRLFTTQAMQWPEIRKRAATNMKWQWHKTEALDFLKDDCIRKDIWRENGGFIDKGPFAKAATDVTVIQQSRDEDSGEALLRVQPVNGDVIYWDKGGAAATTGSAKLDGPTLKTKDMRLSFLCIDSSGVHQQGAAKSWANTITLKHRVFGASSEKRVELQAAPSAAIRYTSDGSDPKLAGATYESDILVPRSAVMILAYAEKEAIQSPVERIPIDWEKGETVTVDPGKPAIWRRRFSCQTTKESYEFLGRLKKFGAEAAGLGITIAGEGSDRDWVELQTFESKKLAPDSAEMAVECLRKLQGNGQVQVSARAVHFASGRALLDWVEEARTTLVAGEVQQ